MQGNVQDNAQKADHIIKKYANRRLYDTVISQYTTLDAIKKLIMEGKQVKIIDAKSQDDLTHSVLLQIISEHEVSSGGLFSTQVLQNIIRFYGSNTQYWFKYYMDKLVRLFIEQQHDFQKQIKNLVDVNPLTMMNEMAKKNYELWRSNLSNSASYFNMPEDLAIAETASAGNDSDER
ncbi:MAG: polyhydroxyalkanoate synthesis repressor PhaR [Gammaproteobacteria bacterium]